MARRYKIEQDKEKRGILYTLQEISEYMGCSTQRIQKYYRDFKFPMVKDGGRWFTSKTLIDKWIQAVSRAQHEAAYNKILIKAIEVELNGGEKVPPRKELEKRLPGHGQADC